MPDVFISPKKAKTIPEKPQSASKTIPSVTTKPDNQEHHMHAFAAFCQDPVGFTFQTQEADEQVLLFLRKHFITNVPWIILSLIFLTLPPLVSPLFSNPDLPFGMLPTRFYTILGLFYYLVVFGYIFANFITWSYNISLVTQKRVMDIDFQDIIYTNVAETKIDLVQDVDYTQIGVFQSIFNFGDVFVHTSGNNPNFDFIQVPQPARATNIIEDLIGRNPNAV